MKIELNHEQVSLLLAGLDEIIDAAERENKSTADEEIHEGNGATIADCEELRDYISNYKEG
jgi:hypothetical protein